MKLAVAALHATFVSLNVSRGATQYNKNDGSSLPLALVKSLIARCTTARLNCVKLVKMRGVRERLNACCCQFSVLDQQGHFEC